MKLFQNVSIKRKVMLITMLTSSVALLLATSGFVTYELLTFRQRMIRELQSEADLIAAQNSATLTYDRPDEAWKYLRASLDAKPYIVAACLYRTNNIFTNYALGGVKNFPWPPA